MLVEVSGIVKEFADARVLDGATFRLATREKVVMVGRNGCGKTTLLRILAGLDSPDTGSVRLARGASVGYLRQDAPVGLGRTVLEEAESGVGRAVELRARLKELEARLEAGPTDEELEEYALVHEHFLEAEGYSLEHDVRTVLSRMGFGEHEFDKMTDQLSGGERTRLALARLLLEEPELLILDEPTNHLDLEAVEWLERWVRAYHGSVLVVSHDRVFLDEVAERVLEMRDGKVFSYPGPFTKFLSLREEEEARRLEVARKTDHEIARLDEYVRRFMGGERTAQARGRLKLKQRMEGKREAEPEKTRSLAGAIQSAGRSGEIVATLEGVSVAYDGQLVLSDVDWTVRRGERWGIIGQNGAGKSTLAKVLLGLQTPNAGRAVLGAKVDAGFFEQDASDLRRDRTPTKTLIDDCGLLPEQARGLLGRFLVSGDDAMRPIGTLSGGERNKVALCRLAALNPNLLVLDEPTNHLDMDSREALVEMLAGYDGTLLLISHDRWLLDHVTSTTLDVRRDGLKTYPGPVSEYRSRSKSRAVSTIDPAVARDKPGKELSPRALSKEIERTTKAVGQIEATVARLESELGGVAAKLGALVEGDDVHRLSVEYGEKQTALASEMERWEQTIQALEVLKALQTASSDSDGPSS